MTTSVDSQVENDEEEKNRKVNVILIIVVLIVSFIFVYFITNIAYLKKLRTNNFPFQKTVMIVVISVLIGIIGFFNAYFMGMVGDQLRPILVFMTLTVTLLFNKYDPPDDNGVFLDDNKNAAISKQRFLESSSEIVDFVKNKSDLYEFILLNMFFFSIMIVHVVIAKYIKMNKNTVELLQQIFTWFALMIMLGYYHSTTSGDAIYDTIETKLKHIIIYVLIFLMCFYLLRMLQKLDEMKKIGINKFFDLSALKFDNIQFLKYIQMVFNGLFLIKFFS